MNYTLPLLLIKVNIFFIVFHQNFPLKNHLNLVVFVKSDIVKDQEDVVVSGIKPFKEVRDGNKLIIDYLQVILFPVLNDNVVKKEGIEKKDFLKKTKEEKKEVQIKVEENFKLNNQKDGNRKLVNH